ncbi:MAG: GNAT family N-acetyltransferase [Chloroflexota bacterium]
MEIRPITPADIEACVEVFYSADEALSASMNLLVMPRNPQAIDGIFRHVSENDPGRAWVAEQGGEVVGFGMAIERDELTFLAFLFVRPDAQSAGLGAQLYDRCMPASGYRATCIWSVQPISAALYARYGLVPRVPMYTMTGRPRIPLPRLRDGLELTSITPAEIDELDREIVGFTRRVDHEAWQRWERRAWALREGEQLIGYGYSQPAGRIGPAVVRRAEDLLPLVGALMDQIEPREDWMVHVPGPAAEPFSALLQAGMRFDGPPVIFCATQPGIDHSRYLPATFALP